MAKQGGCEQQHALDGRDTSSASASPMALGAPNQIKRFYRGGAQIEALRGGSPSDGGPEDWIGSTTTVLGSR